jgi:hypothetical protein
VLDDLVLCVLSTTTLDENISVTEKGDGIYEELVKLVLSLYVEFLTLANVTEPDVLQSASTLAVNTLKLVGTNDNVGESSTVLKDENSVVRSSIGISVTSLSTVILLVSHIL